VLVRGVFLGTKHAARVMQRQGAGGAIVNTGSIAGLAGRRRPAGVLGRQAAVIHFTRIAAAELAPASHPREQHLARRPSRRRWWTPASATWRAAIDGVQPVGRTVGQPDDIARVVESSSPATVRASSPARTSSSTVA